MEEGGGGQALAAEDQETALLSGRPPLLSPLARRFGASTALALGALLALVARGGWQPARTRPAVLAEDVAEAGEALTGLAAQGQPQDVCAAFGCSGGCGACFNPGSRPGKMCDGTGGQSGYFCPPDPTAAKGGDATFACMDWTFGSTAVLAAEASFTQRSGQDVYLGVGTWGSAEGLGACYRLTVEGVDKDIIGQSLNTGHDVAGNQFDMQIGAGGAGAFNTCAGGSGSMFPGTVDPWGCQYGGVDSREECAGLPQYPQDDRAMKAAGDNLVKLCEYAWDKKVRLSGAGRSAGKCQYNPTILDAARVKCPEELVNLTQIQRSDDPSGYKEPSAQGFPNTAHKCTSQVPGQGVSYCLTRMMDCRKPSGGFKDNVKPGLMVPGRKLVQTCTADGYTRINVACGCKGCYC